MHCTSCGSVSQDGTRFCSKCGKELPPPTNSSNPQSSAAARFGTAMAEAVRKVLKLPSWTLLLTLVIGVAVLARFFSHASPEAPHGEQVNLAKAGEQQSTRSSNPTNHAAPQLSPAEVFALALENAQPKYNDIDVGVVNHVLSLISDSFKDRSIRESQAKDLLKSRTSLCGIEIWTVEVGYSRSLFSQEAMEVVPLRCPEEKEANEQELAPRREKFVAELSDANLHVSTNGDTLIFESELFSDFDARAAFLQQMGSNPYYKNLFHELEFTHLELRYRTKTMRTVPIKSK